MFIFLHVAASFHASPVASSPPRILYLPLRAHGVGIVFIISCFLFIGTRAHLIYRLLLASIGFLDSDPQERRLALNTTLPTRQ